MSDRSTQPELVDDDRLVMQRGSAYNRNIGRQMGTVLSDGDVAAGVTDAGNVYFSDERINRPANPHATFAVKVTQVGGSAGSKTTQCDFTYDVTDVYGRTLGSAMSPAKKRPEFGRMVAPNAGSYGVGFYNDAMAFVLWDANEVPDVAAC